MQIWSSDSSTAGSTISGSVWLISSFAARSLIDLVDRQLQVGLGQRHEQAVDPVDAAAN